MKKYIIIVCSLLFLEGIFSIRNDPRANSSNPPSDTETAKLFDVIQNELYGKYEIGIFKLASNPDYTVNEIIIEIYGSQQYYDSVKNEVESLIQDKIKSTSFENYTVKAEKSKIQQNLIKEAEQNPNLLFEITQTIRDNLYEAYPNQMGDINITKSSSNSSPNLIIEVHTLLKEAKPYKIGKEMEDKINIILKEKLSSNLIIKVSNTNILIYNSDEEKIN